MLSHFAKRLDSWLFQGPNDQLSVSVKGRVSTNHIEFAY